MFSGLSNLLGRKAPQKGAPLNAPTATSSSVRRQNDPDKHSFSKVFRWRLPAGAEMPSSVQIVGSFTRWQKVDLTHDKTMDAWHATINQIPGNRTHHYMLLIDGKPTLDKTCDGLAVPHGIDEEQFQMTTEKGPRVLMLFSHTK